LPNVPILSQKMLAEHLFIDAVPTHFDPGNGIQDVAEMDLVITPNE
jgi:hypothetical protein